MKTILLWDPRFPDRRPARLTVEDTVASAAVRAGVAAAANPAEAGALSAGDTLDPTMLTEVVLQHGNGGAIRRVFLPYSVVMVGASAGVLAAIGTPIPGGVTPTPTPTPTPSPHQLVAPTLASSTAIDSTSAALQIGLLYDPLLSDPDGYLGFAVELERATNAGFTAALVTDTILINTPYFDEGVSSREIMHSLTPGVTYYYRASVLPPSDNADYTASPVSNTVPVPIAVGVATTFDVPNSGEGFTFSNSNRTVTSTAGSSAGQTAVVADAHAQQTGKWWFECQLDVLSSDPSDYQVIGLAISATGAGPDFFYSGTGTFRCDNQINFSAPSVAMYWKGPGTPEPLIDSEITLADGRVGFAIDQGDETNGSTRLAIYIKNKKTAFNVCFNANESPVRPYAAIKQPGQITLVPTSFKPAGYQDWKTA